MGSTPLQSRKKDAVASMPTPEVVGTTANSPHVAPPASSPALHPHPVRGRTEAELSESGLTWDEQRREWVADDEATAGSEERDSQRTVGSHHAAAAGSAVAKIGKDQEKQEDVIWVEWDGPNDPGNPFNFSSKRNAVAWAGASFPFGNASLIAELGCSQQLAVVALSTFPLGFGLAPLVLAPFSEAYGRYPMYVYSSALYTILLLPVALGKNIATVIVFRFLSGLAASTGSTLVGGTIADLFDASERGLPMSLFSVCAFAGTGLGPALMGYVGQNLGFRWIQYIQIMFGGVIFIGILLLTKETRGSVILSKRAKQLRKSTGDPRYQCRSDAERASLLVLVKVSMTRPIYLLFTEAIVAAFSLWVAFSWGVLYLALEAVALVMEQVYGFSVGQAGLVFFSVVVASILGFVSNLYQEKLYQKNVKHRGPEARLYGACVGGLVFPAGLFIFAFSQGRGHWIGPVIGLTLAFTGIFTIYLATFNYLADCYTIYASSALSGQSLCRNLAGFSFPLFTFQMYEKLGFQWASFLAGCLALMLAATPYVLMAFGPRIRAASNFARELERMRTAAN